MDADERNEMTTTRKDALDYYRLCDETAKLGIPTSLDDPRSPKTVDELKAAVDAAKRA